MRSAFIGVFVASVVALGCNGGPLAGEYSDGSSGRTPGEALKKVCLECPPGTCAWQTQACAGDPGCARWLACVQSSCATGSQAMLAGACLDTCPSPQTTYGLKTRNELAACLLGESCCVSAATGGAGGPGEWGQDAGDGVDAGAEPGVAPSTEDAGACIECIHQTKPNLPDECRKKASECLHSNPICAEALRLFVECSAGAADQESVRECMLKALSDDGTTNISAAAVAQAADVIACVAKPCAGECVGTCMSCKLNECPDELAAVEANEEAQALYWCRWLCVFTEPGSVASCQEQCREAHQAGFEDARELYLCMAQACRSCL